MQGAAGYLNESDSETSVDPLLGPVWCPKCCPDSGQSFGTKMCATQRAVAHFLVPKTVPFSGTECCATSWFRVCGPVSGPRSWVNNVVHDLGPKTGPLSRSVIFEASGNNFAKDVEKLFKISFGFLASLFDSFSSSAHIFFALHTSFAKARLKTQDALASQMRPNALQKSVLD